MSEQEKEFEIKITDKRKFNVDGSLRDGVVIEPTKKEEPVKSIQEEITSPQVTLNLENNEDDKAALGDFGAEGDEETIDETQIPDAENPTGFANFLLSLASQAAAALGLAENPMTGRRQADLELSKYWIDILGMLREKTRGNLHPQEEKLFDGLLGDLRMQFVQLNRAAAEQLKQQAAKKFSGKDILGR